MLPFVFHAEYFQRHNKTMHLSHLGTGIGSALGDKSKGLLQHQGTSSHINAMRMWTDKNLRVDSNRSVSTMNSWLAIGHTLFALLKCNVDMKKHVVSCREHIRNARLHENCQN